MLSEFTTRGLFRPTIWRFYKTIAGVVGANPFALRLTWIFWCMLASLGMLTLLRELRIDPLAAFAATAIAMLSTFRNDMWMAFGLTEAIAMPFAMLSPICALSAGRSHSLGWDILRLLSTLLRVETKNVFAAVIPAQVFLRVAAAEQGTLAQALRRRWLAAAIWSLPPLLPIIHLIFFLSLLA